MRVTGAMSIAVVLTALNGCIVQERAYAPPPRVHYDDTPSYNDPSKFGGQSLGMDP